MPLYVNEITTKTGQRVRLGDFNVLVGPNNSGKSQTLRDIRDYVCSGSTNQLKIIDDIALDLPTEREATSGLQVEPHSINPGHEQIRGVSSDLLQRKEISPVEGWVSQQLERAEDPNMRRKLLLNLGTYWVAHLNAEGRFRLAAPTESYDVRSETPANAMQAFFAGCPEALQPLRSAFRDAFGIDIALDWAGLRKLYLRVGEEFGEIPEGRSQLDELLKGAEGLEAQGDGYRSFAGVVLSMLTFSERLLLLDEPDAFLHPAQARTLGRWMAEHAKQRNSQVILATHNSDFLWGVVSTRNDATVIRLNRIQDKTSYRSVPPETVSMLATSPLLSSQPVLDSLFQRGVVVCEGDPDRAVYQTVAHVDLRNAGGEEIMFIHTNGKDAVRFPVELLRNAGTPVCAIVDFDVLNSEAVFRHTLHDLTGSNPPNDLLELRRKIAEHVERATEDELLEDLRNQVSDWAERPFADLREARRALSGLSSSASKWAQAKKYGLDHFQGKERETAERLLEQCKQLGLFIVPVGQLESWMAVDARKGKHWNRRALEALHEGQCPAKLKSFVEESIEHLLSG